MSGIYFYLDIDAWGWPTAKLSCFVFLSYDFSIMDVLGRTDIAHLRLMRIYVVKLSDIMLSVMYQTLLEALIVHV